MPENKKKPLPNLGHGTSIRGTTLGSRIKDALTPSERDVKDFEDYAMTMPMGGMMSPAGAIANRIIKPLPEIAPQITPEKLKFVQQILNKFEQTGEPFQKLIRSLIWAEK